ncbi:HAD family phosphatase [Rathayibacter sp. YIM 133350]|uniref:HAD family hydrolase n=1 Tax=Rathayibacter sp. YIM 133350 TaxID=3131992 RepID=UPI00307E957F
MNGTDLPEQRSPITLPGRVVVFDYGEVISLEPSLENRRALLHIAGVPAADADAFWSAYWSPRAELDRCGISIREYWRSVGDAIGRSFGDELVHQLWLTDFTGWLSINPGTATVLEDLAAGGTRLALLSNAGPDYSSFFRSGSLGPLFEQAFVSGELGLIKPDPAIYRHALEALGIEPHAMVFIDNKAENVESAQALGITGHVFTTPAELRAFLTALAAE